MIRRQHVVSDFFEEAESMREALDSSLRNTYTDRISWQYFCDPQMYAYLRTMPDGVFQKELSQRFMKRLRSWCMENLGLLPMGMPYLNMMVNGCRLGLHSDFHNGAWGYVYSLTRWDDRKFSGGETLLMRDGVPSYKKHHVHGEVLYELVPAKFNQLLIFDDRIVHATPTVEGSMDPLHARIAMVGHIRATSPLVNGNIEPVEARRIIVEAMAKIQDRTRNYRDVQGTITYRISLGRSGKVESATILTDNVITASSGYDVSDAVAAVKAIIQQTITGLRFPAGDGESIVVVPVLVPIPDLRRIEVSIAHSLPRDVIHKLMVCHIAQEEKLKLEGEWQQEVFNVEEPLAGSVRIESHRLVISFDPPMWVPSQRESFQMSLAEWVKSISAKIGIV